jgi:hypothetical protein
MAERVTGLESRGKRWLVYALGILTESAYVVSIILVVLVLIWLISRWF